MIEELKKINQKLIAINKNNPQELQKYELIEKILNKKDCFSNMDIEYAYSILHDLKIPKADIKKVYIELISKNN